jgi:DNA repair protein RecO (recombination protein O)
MMQTCNCEAVVLGTMDYREADKIVTLFTLEHGKLRGVARGAKKSVKRFGGALELFARLNLEISLKEGLAQIYSADIVTVFPRIREELLKIGLASYVCELTDAMLPEGMCIPRFFRLLTAYLEQLDLSPATLSDRRFFELNFLNIIGYRPELEHCVVCAIELTGIARSNSSTAASGLMCGKCGRGERPVSMATLILLRRTLRTGRFGVINFSPAELEEAQVFIDWAIASHLQRPLKTLSFLRETG